MHFAIRLILTVLCAIAMATMYARGNENELSVHPPQPVVQLVSGN